MIDCLKILTDCLPKILNPAKDGEECEAVVEEGDDGAYSNSRQAQSKQARIVYVRKDTHFNQTRRKISLF